MDDDFPELLILALDGSPVEIDANLDPERIHFDAHPTIGDAAAARDLLGCVVRAERRTYSLVRIERNPFWTTPIYTDAVTIATPYGRAKVDCGTVDEPSFHPKLPATLA